MDGGEGGGEERGVLQPPAEGLLQFTAIDPEKNRKVIDGSRTRLGRCQ